MRVVSNKALVDFAEIHPAASIALQAWRRAIEGNTFAHYAALKKTFNATDRARGFYIFDVGGNK